METKKAEIKNEAVEHTGLKNREISLIVSEIQLLLSEKRTALSILRTGIAVLAIPISVLSVLIATSRYYNPEKVLHLLIPVLVICLAMVFLSLYLVIRSIRKLHAVEHIIQELKKRSKDISDLIT